MNSNFFETEKANKQFKTLKIEFIQSISFWLCILLAFFFLFGLHRAPKEIVKCSMEEIKMWKAKDYFFEKGEYFGIGGEQSSQRAKSGNFSLFLKETISYGLAYAIPVLEGNEKIKVSVWQYCKNTKGCSGRIVAEVKGGVFWKSGNQKVEKDENGWERIQFEIEPPSTTKSKQLDLYVWNSGKTPIWFDDLKIEVIKE